MNDRTADLFSRALELDSGKRTDFLTRECGQDVELRVEVEQLLLDAAAADEYFTGSFGAAAWAGETVTTGGGRVGDCAGPYRLLRQLGEGGFGVVWLAEQVEPIRRKVAVKVIKAGMDSREVLARFASERQALARMGHPNIARVLEVGLTAAGHPYFAMEWVDGMPINRFCDEHELALGDRLQLFSDVCSAISHAHQKGVIHRDIKPGNVLVTLFDGKPLPKVIDFGIAKATAGRLFDGTLLTRTEQWIGTPGYMSPEQAGLGNVELDSRSDIYGLGALLYELLTGLQPFGQTTLSCAGYDEMRRIIREVEPKRPSVRLGALPPAELAVIAGARKVSATKLCRIINSDLDWIILKAMEKSRDRRYATAAGLAEDIGRFLRNEPVTAKPPSPLYIIGKFAKRHKAGFRTACGFVILLVAATVFSTRLALRATREELNRNNSAVIRPTPTHAKAAFNTTDPAVPVAAPEAAPNVTAKTSPKADPSAVVTALPKVGPASTALPNQAKAPSIQLSEPTAPEHAQSLRERAEAGDAEAQYQLVRADPHNWDFSATYNNTKETQETMNWIRKAAEQGHPQAQYHLANCFQYGKGVNADATESVKWYRRAAAQGVDNACLFLGSAYLHGHGLPKDATMAAKWFRQGAKSDLSSRFALGELYLEGNGVPKDLVQALMWFELYSATGVPIPKPEMRDTCAKEMTSEQIAEAKRLASEWKPESSPQLIQPDSSAVRVATPSLPVHRVLTDSTGRKLDATILGKSATAIKGKRTSDGVEFTIDLNKLSVVDQEYIEGLDRSSSHPAESATPTAAP